MLYAIGSINLFGTANSPIANNKIIINEKVKNHIVILNSAFTYAALICFSLSFTLVDFLK